MTPGYVRDAPFGEVRGMMRLGVFHLVGAGFAEAEVAQGGEFLEEIGIGSFGGSKDAADLPGGNIETHRKRGTVDGAAFVFGVFQMGPQLEQATLIGRKGRESSINGGIKRGAASEEGSK